MLKGGNILEQSDCVCRVCGKPFINYVGKDWCYTINVKECYATLHDKPYFKYKKYQVCSYTCKRDYDKQKGGL